MIVRPARFDELDDVARLTVDAYSQYRAGLGDELWDGYEQELASVTDHARRGTALVAESDGELIGSVWILPSTREPDRMYFRYLAVSPTARGRNLGRTLVDACIEHARAAGKRRLCWRTASFMEPAIALYTKMGFEPVDEGPIVGDLRFFRYEIGI